MEENRAKRKLSESDFSLHKDSENQQKSRMEGLKRRVEEARKFNLLSDAFMSVALRDRAAAQGRPRRHPGRGGGGQHRAGL